MRPSGIVRPLQITKVATRCSFPIKAYLSNCSKCTRRSQVARFFLQRTSPRTIDPWTQSTTSGSHQPFAPLLGSSSCVMFVCLLVGCLTSQQHASVSQGRICTDNFTCCHTEIEAADPTFRLTQSQCTDTGPTSPSADPITPGAWQGSHWSANFKVTGMTRPPKKSRR